MENRKKFYANYGSRQQTGAWGKDTLQDRYEHVCGALKAYKSRILDEQDLSFAIKNAFVSKVYVSCGVVKAYPTAYPPNQNPLFGELSPLYKELLKNGKLDFPNIYTFYDKDFNYMNICELGTVVNPQVKADVLRTRIYIEHVIPAKVYMETVINAYKEATDVNGNFINTNKENDFKQVFNRIFNVVSVCLVTDDENSRLNKVGRSKMPNNIGLLEDSFDPFARYKAANKEVKIWKQCGQFCPGITNCPYMKTP